MVIIAESKNISEYEKRKFKKKGEFLLVGKSDRSINVVSGEEIIPIKELAVANRSANYQGSLSIPTEEGIPFVIQYGVVSIQPNTTIDVVFYTPFTNRVFQVQATLSNETDDESIIKAIVINGDSTKFRLKRIGGTLTEYVRWMAIGF